MVNVRYILIVVRRHVAIRASDVGHVLLLIVTRRVKASWRLAMKEWKN